MKKWLLAGFLSIFSLQALAQSAPGEQFSRVGWEKEKNSHEDFAEAVQAMGARGTTLAMPVTVLSRGLPHTTIRQAKMRYEDVDAFNSTWDTSQFELAKISGNARHVRMHYAAHLFDEQDPWLVIDEIGLLLKRAATPAP